MSDFDTDTITEGFEGAAPEAEVETGVEAGAEAPAETEAEATERKARIAPSYKVDFVGGGLPESDTTIRRPRKPGSGGGAGRRNDMFVKLLAPISEDTDLWGNWLQVAEYGTAAGAAGAMKAIKAGEREIPHGVWEFDVRRFNVDADKNPVTPGDETGTAVKADGTVISVDDVVKISRLYAYFHGVDVDADVEYATGEPVVADSENKVTVAEAAAE